MGRKQLLEKIRNYLEKETLGFTIDEDISDIQTFLSGLEWRVIEDLLRGLKLSQGERNDFFGLIEERKGELEQKNLPIEEQHRRQEEGKFRKDRSPSFLRRLFR